MQPAVCEKGGKLSSRVADGFNRATFHCLFALSFFVRRGGLLVNEGVPTVVIPREVVGSRFAAQIAIDALVIDEKLSCDVVGLLVSDVSHKMLLGL